MTDPHVPDPTDVDVLIGYAAACFARLETRHEDSLCTALFEVAADGLVTPILSTDQHPRWPHACGSARDVCMRCAPHLFQPAPRLTHAGAGKPYATVSRYHRRDPALDARIVLAPPKPGDRNYTDQVGWQARESKLSSRVVSIVLANWDRAATGEALVALALELTDRGKDVTLGFSLYYRPDGEDHAALDRAIARHRGDVDGPGSTIRRRHERDLVDVARAIFAADPALRSVMLAIGQYYSDQASDELHAEVFASERDVPVWPHECPRTPSHEPTREQLGTERCRWCGKLPVLDLDYLGAIAGLGPFCVEGANQDQDRRFSHRPYAIVRRDSVDGAIELVGASRHASVRIGVVGDGADAVPWPDARAVTLAADPESRAVLADHLIELGDPRGERLAHGEPAMLNPLGRVIVTGGARFAGGLLVGAEVFCDDDETAIAVRGAVAWSTVETLRYLPRSRALLDPAMRSLRELHLAGRTDVQTIAAADPPFPLETIHTRDTRALAKVEAAQLPRLRHLIVNHPNQTDIVAVLNSSWWGQIERVTIVDGNEAARTLFAAGCGDVAWCDVDDLGRPAGWQTRFFTREARIEISLVNFHPDALRSGLRDAIAAARLLAPDVTVVPSRYYIP